MPKQFVELEDMGDEELSLLRNYLSRCVYEAEIEEDWRDSETTELLPLLRGLERYITKEFLGEDLEDYGMDDDLEHDPDDESDELDF